MLAAARSWGRAAARTAWRRSDSRWKTSVGVTRRCASGTGARPVQFLVLDDREGELRASPALRQLAANPEVALRVLGPETIHDVADEELKGLQVMMALRERTSPIDGALLDRLPSLELILQSGGHAYHVDMDACTQRGIPVVLGRGVQAPRQAVPELTFALAMAAFRHLPAAYAGMDAGEWPALMGRTLGGKRIGLLGSGRLGTHVARIARGFGMDVVAWDRAGKDSGAMRRLGGLDGPEVEMLSLDEVLGTSDVVSIHLKLSPESRGLLNAETLAKMKRGSVLINTSRGPIVDEDALIAALSDDDAPLAAAGLDVFTVEPLPTDSPLRALPNAVLTPHIGFTVVEVFHEFAAIARRQLINYMQHTLNVREVANPEVLSTPAFKSKTRVGTIVGEAPK